MMIAMMINDDYQVMMVMINYDSIDSLQGSAKKSASLIVKIMMVMMTIEIDDAHDDSCQMMMVMMTGS